MNVIVKSSKQIVEKKETINSKTLVVAYLYYYETVDYYLDYLGNIPEECKLILITSNENLVNSLEEFKEKNNNKSVCVIIKKNRGRDITAFLITAKKYILDSDYFCFIHDKRPNHEYLKDDINCWVDRIWRSMLDSESYIRNIISLFESDNSLGALFPPGPLGDSVRPWYEDSWFKNYDNTVKLGKKLRLNIEINRSDFVVSLGTVLWARTYAIRPLFNVDWLENDFPEEPVPSDGTISHAIERILEYVVRNQGYVTSYIMPEDLAAEIVGQLLQHVSQEDRLIKGEFPIFNYKHVLNWEERERVLIAYVRAHRGLYIYGAGEYGGKMKSYLESVGATVKGFLITDNKCTDFNDKKGIYLLGEIAIGKDDGVVIAVSEENRLILEENLRKKGFTDFIYGY